MGFELDRLMQQYGAATPVSLPAGAAGRSMYSAEQYQPGRPTVPAITTFSQLQREAMAPGGGGQAEANRRVMEWLTNNPNATQQQIQAAMREFGVTEFDLLNARNSLGGAGGLPSSAFDRTISTFPVLPPAAGVGRLPVLPPATERPAPTPAPREPVKQPLYESLNASSTPEQVAEAYRQFVAERGGDTEANRNEALSFLRARGISQPVINSAYDFFKANEVRASSATAPAAGVVDKVAGQALSPMAGDTFSGGRALNQQYKDLVKSESGFDLPDLSPYTGKYLSQYTGELATPASRAGLINDMSVAAADAGATGGYYQPGDLTPVIGSVGRQANSNDWWNNYYNSVFGDGNSYFLPDTSEVTYTPREIYGAFRKPGETDEQVHNRLYYGNRFLGSGRADTSQNPEYSIRKLLTPSEAENPYNLIRENAGNLVSFDVGRGDLNYDQGYAASRLLEAKDQYDEWNRILNQYRGDAASLQNELADFKAPTGWEGGDANLAQLKSDKQANLDRLNASIAAGNPQQQFYDKILAGAKTIDPATYGRLSSAALLREAGLGAGEGSPTSGSAPASAPEVTQYTAPATAIAPATTTQAAPGYMGLTSASSPAGIASAYNEFIASRGGDTEANRAEALQYLQSKGIDQPAINQAYDVFKQKAFARGGAVETKRFALGGLNEADQREDFAGLAERYGAQLPEEPAPQAMAAPGAAPAVPQPMGLESMLAKYMQPVAGGMNYGQELAAARKTAQAETDAFQKLLQQAIAQPDQPPSKSELYFRLAAAFAEPGKTGSFGEGLGKAAGAVAEQKKSEREAAKASAAQKLQLGLTAQQARMQGAREDVGTLRTLAAEDEKSKRAVTSELLKEWVKKNDPVSTAGKQAQDEGLQPGTPAFQARVKEISDTRIEQQLAGINATVAQIGVAAAQLGLAQSKEKRAEAATKKLSPSEVKLRTETEDLVQSADSAMDMLKRAYELSPQAFDSSLPDTVQRKVLEAAGSKDKKLLATREMENLLGEQALAKLKATFGGAPTEGERAILMQLSGIGAKSREERDQILKNAFRVLRDRRAAHQRRLADVKAGAYSEKVEAD